MRADITEDIPVEVLFKYLLKDYRREQQYSEQLNEQINILLKRNTYLEKKFGTMNARLQKMTEKKVDYPKEIEVLHQAISGRNNTINQLKNENTQLKKQLDKYAQLLGEI